MLELAILGLLEDEQPLHGYELRKRLGDTLGYFWGVSYGSLYPALRRLEKAGDIEAVTAPELVGATAPIPATGSIGGETAAARLRQRLTSKSGRAKKSYRITAQGSETFGRLMAETEGSDDERTFVLKLAFCNHLDDDARVAFLERRRNELLERLNTTRDAGAKGNRYTRSLVEHRTRSTESDLEWIDELIAAEREERTAEAQRKGATA